MRLENLRQADLNLLVAFAAIAEEGSVTRAAERLRLSQPAVSRALQRARALFRDELLIRTPTGLEPTVRAREVLKDLESLLPRIDRMIAPGVFDPAVESAKFRISGPDNACAVVAPPLCRRYGSGFKVAFEFHPWQAGITDLVERGLLDLILQIDDGLLPGHFHSEPLYREDWVCVVASESCYGRQMTLAEYQAAQHLVVGTYAGVQTIPDKRMAAIGVERRSCMRIPYFGMALACLPGTNLVLTATGGMRPLITANRGVRLVEAPKQLGSFQFLMAWHGRLHGDPRHQWLRAAIREAV